MNEHIDSLIARRLSGEGSPAEEAELDSWIAGSPEHAAYYREMEAAWHAMDEVVGGPQFNTAVAWDRVATRIHSAADDRSGEADNSARPKVIHFSTWIKLGTVAAAILIIALLFLQPEPKEIRVLASNDNQEIRLPDNSLIRLRKGSTVRYPATFSATERLIHLEGEAFFDISKREDQRFVVDAGSVAVTVLATSFNVRSGAQTADVSVATGRVQLVAKDYAGKKILLRAGRAAHFSNGSFEEAPAASLDTAWLHRELVYTTTPLKAIILEIAADSDTPVVIMPAIPQAVLDSPLKIRFKATDPMKERLRKIDLVAGTESVWQGKVYVIRMPIR